MKTRIVTITPGADDAMVATAADLLEPKPVVNETSEVWALRSDAQGGSAVRFSVRQTIINTKLKSGPTVLGTSSAQRTFEAWIDDARCPSFGNTERIAHPDWGTFMGLLAAYATGVMDGTDRDRYAAHRIAEASPESSFA